MNRSEVVPRIARWRRQPATTRRRMPMGPEVAIALLYLWVSGCLCAIAGVDTRVGFLFVLVPTLGLLAGLVYSSRSSRAAREDAEMLEDGESWIAQVWIVQNEVVTGSDRGVVWYEPGSIGFVGRRTSFVVTSEDVDPSFSIRVKLHGCYDALRDRYALSLRLPDGTKWHRRIVYLYFRLLNPPPGYLTSTPATFAARLLELPNEKCSVEPQFPPIELGPGSESRWSIRLRSIGPYIAPFTSLALVFYAVIGIGRGLVSEGSFALLTIFGLLGFALTRLTAHPRRLRLHALNGLLHEEYGSVDPLERIGQGLSNVGYVLRGYGGPVALLMGGVACAGFACYIFRTCVAWVGIYWDAAWTGMAVAVGLVFLIIGHRLCLDAYRSLRLFCHRQRGLSPEELSKWEM